MQKSYHLFDIYIAAMKDYAAKNHCPSPLSQEEERKFGTAFFDKARAGSEERLPKLYKLFFDYQYAQEEKAKKKIVKEILKTDPEEMDGLRLEADLEENPDLRLEKLLKLKNSFQRRLEKESPGIFQDSMGEFFTLAGTCPYILVCYEIAEIYTSKGEFEKALNEAEWVFKCASGDDLGIRNLLACLYYKLKRTEDFEALWKKTEGASLSANILEAVIEFKNGQPALPLIERISDENVYYSGIMTRIIDISNRKVYAMDTAEPFPEPGSLEEAIYAFDRFFKVFKNDKEFEEDYNKFFEAANNYNFLTRLNQAEFSTFDLISSSYYLSEEDYLTEEQAKEFMMNKARLPDQYKANLHAGLSVLTKEEADMAFYGLEKEFCAFEIKDSGQLALSRSGMALLNSLNKEIDQMEEQEAAKKKQ